MEKKQTKSKSVLLIAAAVLAVAAAAVVIALVSKNCRAGRQHETEPKTETEAPVVTVSGDLALGDGIRILSVTRYAGYFVEDGSNDIVSGIAAVRVRNDGVKSVQLLSFTLSDSHGQPYEFQITTLLPGQELLALEKNRRALNIDTEIVSAAVENRAYFSETPTLYSQQLRLVCADNCITVENISSDAVPAGYVYYKNVSNELWVGGITYRSAFKALSPGEKVTIQASHYTDALSRVAFVTYVQQ